MQVNAETERQQLLNLVLKAVIHHEGRRPISTLAGLTDI